MKTAFRLLNILSLMMLLSCDPGNKGEPDRIILNGDWKIQSSEKTNHTGSELSAGGISTSDWYNARVPSTVMGVLTASGLYNDITGTFQNESIDKTLLDYSWWYRTEFTMAELFGNQYASLCFEGLTNSAKIWLNGELLTPYNNSGNQWSFDVTSFLKENNVLAVEVSRNLNGSTENRLDSINPHPQGNMGIFGNVYIDVTGRVDILNPHVETRLNTSTLTEAWLDVEATLVNRSDRKMKGKLIGEFEGRIFEMPLKMLPGEERQLKLSADDIPELFVPNPRVWWCTNLGNPEMYEMSLRFEAGSHVSDSEMISFGIRQIKEYTNKKGNRGIILNGLKLLIRGSQWSNDVFLRDTPETNEIQVRYARDMRLNAIHLGNENGIPKDLAALCDKYGLLLIDEEKLTANSSAGLKSAGPFEYVGPGYWYQDTLYGGAFGFSTGAGIGAQLPVAESLSRIKPADKLWPTNDILTRTIENKYGKATDLNDYLRKADLLNYETSRSMFEAYRVNVRRATGIIQWKLHPSYPSLNWQAYDYFFIPNPAYYAIKLANAPQQLVFNYKDGAIYYIDEIHTPVEAKAIVSLYGSDSNILHEATINFRVESDSSKKIFQMDSIAGNLFLSLQLFDKKDSLLARNFYCLSGKRDVYDWEKSSPAYTPILEYADFSELAALPETEPEITTSIASEGGKRILTVNINNNTPVISLMTRLTLKNTGGEIAYPVFWEDNYISVLPGENRRVECTFDNLKVSDDGLYLEVSAWNGASRKITID